jgi:hypothetical protein
MIQDAIPGLDIAFLGIAAPAYIPMLRIELRREKADQFGFQGGGQGGTGHDAFKHELVRVIPGDAQ